MLHPALALCVLVGLIVLGATCMIAVMARVRKRARAEEATVIGQGLGPFTRVLTDNSFRVERALLYVALGCAMAIMLMIVIIIRLVLPTGPLVIDVL